MSQKYLIYNFSGELDDISHLFPNERLGRIAAIIKKHGKEVDIVDRANLLDLMDFGGEYMGNLGKLSFYDTNELYESRLNDEAQDILNNNYDVIFLNLWNGTGFKFSIDLANLIKKATPNIKIYGVGQKVDWFKEHILKLSNNGLDGLVTGLGYNAIEGIVLNKKAKTIPNLILYDTGKIKENAKTPINVDNYPTALYDKNIYRNIEYKIPLYSITLSNQACPNKCVFCIRPENYGRINKARIIENVLNELEQLNSKYNAAHFRIEDSTPPKNALSELSKAILNSKLKSKIKLSAFSRVDSNAQESFALLKEAGFVALFFGIESLDDKNLVKLKKGITYKQINDSIKKANKAGIYTIGSFIFPIPGETKQSMGNTLKGINELKPFLSSLLVLPAGIYPNTEWSRNPSKFGIQLDDKFVEKFVIYPIKYLLPFQCWPPFPFKYEIMDKKVENVDFEYILEIYRTFLDKVSKEFKIPSIPDYYFLLADLLKGNYTSVTKAIINYMVSRDYPAIKNLFSGSPQ
ncbi:MAG: radical SAM protein [Candidatus Ratteibacteria bacterium]|nr:radical SAM protein [Candidatus Ratteibacteria bacterium]